MSVRKNHGCRFMVQGALDDFVWIDGRLSQRAAEHHFHFDQPILCVQEHHREHLMRYSRKMQLQELLHGVWRTENFPAGQLFADGSPAKL
jgi:hypothetical protein